MLREGGSSDELAILGEAGSGYTDTIINALIQAAEGSARNAHATAALESAAGLYQAAFSAAKVEPEQEALGPSFLGEAARRLIRYGQTVYLIEVEDGKIRLRDVASWNIGGGPNEEDWTYECEMAGPTKSETIRRPSSGVVHFRYAVDPLRPWEGLGPLQSASATGTLMGALEQRLGEESAAPSALLLPIPADGGRWRGWGSPGKPQNRYREGEGKAGASQDYLWGIRGRARKRTAKGLAAIEDRGEPSRSSGQSPEGIHTLGHVRLSGPDLPDYRCRWNVAT